MKKDIKYIDLNGAAEPEISGESRERSETNRPKSSRPKKKPLKKGKLTVSQKAGSVMAVVGTTFLTMLLIAIITVCIVAVALTVYIMQFAENSFDIDLKAAELNFTTSIKAFDPDAGEDDEGEWVVIKMISGDENRIWIDIGEMPQHLIDAVIANEDHRFFEHEGVDWFGTMGVILREMFSDEDTRGASTITQQLVKNVTGDDRVNAGRKLREIFRALSLEQRYTKLDILESYLNRIGFGGTSCGVQSAAWYYFDKDVRDVTIAEAALMAGVIPSPHNWNPYINSRAARIRQEYALEQMYSHGFISTAEYEQALAEELRFRRPVAGDYFGYIDERYNEWAGLFGDGDEANLYFEDTPWEDLLPIAYKWNGDYEVTQNWYTDALIWQVSEHLSQQRGIDRDRALELLRSGGFTIYSNENIKMQAKLEELSVNPNLFVQGTVAPDTPVNELLQGAFVVMDYSGRVRALIGGFGEKPGDNCFNRAVQSIRAIGSTTKPISVYAPAIDMNAITYSTYTKDASGEIRANPNDPDSPREIWPFNWGSPVSVPGSNRHFPTWYSIQKSLNTISVRTLSKIGFQASYSMMVDKLGFTDIDSTMDMNWSPLALGALTHGAKLHELTAAYAIFGNSGLYYEPYLYDRVVDNNGRIILEQNLTGTQAIEKDSAWVMNRMLLKVVTDPAGSGRFSAIDNIEVIGKTGTSNDMKNLLYCAMTPEYVASYRIGYDQHMEMENFVSGRGWRSPAQVWGDIMRELVDNSVPQSFTPDSTVLELPYCWDTGMLAIPGRCPSTEIGYYRTSNLPSSCNAASHQGATTGATRGPAYWAIHGDPDNVRPQYN
ncbi:MAG: transglycosylase domain-containing protein [Oscillospiraceae bacterium]|jgi:penicillin-binding protein 1A|nr:transglycosylase domain-containing protein [Oscillospiraceae bacterium]